MALNPEKATGRIKITRVPRGEAPDWVRKAWVGLTVPCYPIAGYIPGGEATLSFKKRLDPRQCFVVPQAKAIDALAKTNPEAAQWWNDHGFPWGPLSFTFGEGEAEIVSGVRFQKLIEVTDEMMGNPNR